MKSFYVCPKISVVTWICIVACVCIIICGFIHHTIFMQTVEQKIANGYEVYLNGYKVEDPNTLNLSFYQKINVNDKNYEILIAS